MKRLLILLAFLALAPAAYAVDLAPDEPLSPVAAAVSGVPEAKVYCGGQIPGAWGDVVLDDNRDPIPNEYLDPILCTYLHRFQAGWRPSPICRKKPYRCSVGYLALSVLVLTHESIHISGDLDEASTECKAVQRMRGVFKLLGEPANPLYVEALMRYAHWWHLRETRLETWYGRPYYSPDCVPGGPMDESPGDGVWP